MLLKDLEIKIEDSGIDCFTNLVIKRDGKHYQIPIRTKDLPDDPEDFTPQRIKENIDKFLLICEKFDKNYRLMTEEELGDGPVKLSQEEIEL